MRVPMSIELIVLLSCLGGILLVAAVVYAVRSRKVLPPSPPQRELPAEPTKPESALPLPEKPAPRPAPRAGERAAPGEAEAMPLPYDKPRVAPAPERAEVRRYKEGLARTRGGFVA